MENFFTDAFNNMNDEAKESFYKAVFMNDDSEYAAKLRVEYYRTKFKSMGENVTIGKGVKDIGTNAFYGCNSLACVYYVGTPTEWSGISIDKNNTTLASTERCYYSDSEPTDPLNKYWHFVGGVPTDW